MHLSVWRMPVPSSPTIYAGIKDPCCCEVSFDAGGTIDSFRNGEMFSQWPFDPDPSIRHPNPAATSDDS
jgi:hypothetical protein